MGLGLFIGAMWGMVLALCAFLILFVAHIDTGPSSEVLESAVQALLAVAAVVLLVVGLSRLKRAYIGKKLR